MFLLAAGVVLPPAPAAEGLRQRPELWRHLAHELSEQVCGAGSFVPRALWFVCADGAPAPAALLEPITALLENLPGLHLVHPELESGELARWLRSSPVVLVLQLAAAPGEDPSAALALRNERLSQALPPHSTLVLTLPRQGDGLQRTVRYAGSRSLAEEQERHPARALIQHHGDWHTAQQRLIDTLPRHGLSARGWRTGLAVAWALERSRNLLQRSDRRLLLKAIAMAMVLVALAPLLHQLTTRFIPAVLLLAVGGAGLSVQPLRQRAQQWWCLAQALWVQDTWHRFALREQVAERLPHHQPLDAAREPGQLLQLLRSHDLALAVEPSPPAWGREELADAIAALEQHGERVDHSIRQRQSEQRLMLLPAWICAVLLLGVAAVNAVLIKQAILVAATALIALWLHRPLPLVRRERLIRHRRALSAEIGELRRGLAGVDLAEPHLRAALAASIHRVGVELIDLANDALEAANWSWTFTP